LLLRLYQHGYAGEQHHPKELFFHCLIVLVRIVLKVTVRKWSDHEKCDKRKKSCDEI
jgi:hypothetical protein